MLLLFGFAVLLLSFAFPPLGVPLLVLFLLGRIPMPIAVFTGLIATTLLVLCFTVPILGIPMLFLFLVAKISNCKAIS
jgi:hypothetical protein